MSVKKEAKRSAIEVAADEEGKGEADLRFKSLFTVCQRRRGLSDDEETSFEKYCFFGIKDEMMVTISVSNTLLASCYGLLAWRRAFQAIALVTRGSEKRDSRILRIIESE